MSQLNVSTDLILNRDRFSAELREAEAEIRAMMERVGSTPVNVAVTGGGNVIASGGNGAAAASAENIAPTTATMHEGAELLRSAAMDLKQGIIEFRDFIQDFGGVISEMQAAVGQLMSATVSLSGMGRAVIEGGLSSDTLSDKSGDLFKYEARHGTAKAAAGAAAGAEAEEEEGGNLLQQRLLRSSVGGLIGFYGVAQLDLTIRQRAEESEITRTARTSAEIADRELEIKKQRNEGLMGWMRRTSHKMSFRVGNQQFGDEEDTQGEQEQAERNVRDAQRDEERAKQYDEAIDQTEKLNIRNARETMGDPVAKRLEMHNFLIKQERTANELKAAGHKQAADDLLDASRTTAQLAVQRADQQEEAQDASSKTRIAGVQSSAALASMAASGLGSEAAVETKRLEVTQNLSELRDRFDRATDPNEKRRAGNEWMAAQFAAPHLIAAIDEAERQGRHGDELSTAAAVSAAQGGMIAAQMRAQGDPIQAAMFAQKFAIDQRTREAHDAMEMETDPTRKRQRQQILDATRAEGEEEKHAIDEDERRRKLHNITEMTIDAHHTMLQTAKDDYEAETKVFNEQWAERIKKMQDAGKTKEEIDAAQGQRAAESAVREQRHQIDLLQMHDQGSSAFLRGAGNGALADVMDFRNRVREELRAAGGDKQQQDAVIYRARGQLQEMARAQLHPEMFHSWQEMHERTQMEILSGRGQGLGAMQQLYTALGQMHTGGKAAADDLSRASKKLEDVANKWLNAPGVFVLR